jgi:hypothetical protein
VVVDVDVDVDDEVDVEVDDVGSRQSQPRQSHP